MDTDRCVFSGCGQVLVCAGGHEQVHRYVGGHSRWVWFHLHLRSSSTRAMGCLLYDELSRGDGLEVPGKLLSQS